MKHSRSKLTILSLAVCLAVAGAIAAFSAVSSTAAVKAAPSVVNVIAGKPSELAFKLSKISNIGVGTVTFKVTNVGAAYHTFEICASPIKGLTKNSCVGKTTPVLKHGQSATLTFKFTKSGKYEYLCTIPGHAAAGMKGIIGVGVVVTAAAAKAASPPATTTTTTSTSGGATTTSGGAATTTTSGGTKTGGGGGPALSECPAGTTIPSSGNADADGDELGTEPTDNDGCV